VERKLAAILAADVVGYSRLMEHDEASTRAALRDRQKSILAPLVALNKGRVVKLMGDGVLVEFASAVNAVQCAVELQQKMAEANVGLQDERIIVLRIGINLGDVAVEGEDLFGDGVNIAARLERIAEPGSVCISGPVYDQVKGKLKFDYENLGPQPLKNISEPVQAYCIRDDPHRKTRGPEGALLPLPSKPSVAVLPFDNLSGDTDQEYFSDGVTEDIITGLSRFRSLFVIARNSSFQYRGKAIDVKRVGRELGVQYVLEGSLRKSGNHVRITAQLIDAVTSSHIWAERYDRSIDDLFEIQDELSRTIVSTLVGKIESAAIAATKRKRTENMQAYDYLLQAIEAHQRFTREDNVNARALLERAIELDPQFALPFARLALTYVTQDFNLTKAYELASRAVALDDQESACHQALGYVCLYLRLYDKALAHTEKAVFLNPNDSHALVHLGAIFAYTGKPENSVQLVSEAIRLNPFHPDWYVTFLAIALYGLKRYREAAMRLLNLSTPHRFNHAVAAACAAQAGMIEETRSHVTALLKDNPRFRARDYAKASFPFFDPADLEHFLEGLLKAGLPE